MAATMGSPGVGITSWETEGASTLSSLHAQRSNVLDNRKALAVLERETMLENRKLQHEQLSIIDKLVQEVTNLREQLQAAHSHVDNVDEQLLRVAQRNESEVAQQVAMLSLQLAEKNAMLEASEAERQQLGADLERSKADRDFLTRSLGELEHAQTQLSNLLQVAEQDAQEKQRHNEKVEAELSLLHAQFAAIHVRADGMVGELAEAAAERSRRDEELASLRDVIAQAQAAMREQQEALEELASDREHAIAKLSGGLQEMASLRAEAATAWKSHAEVAKNLDVANSALLLKTKECEHLEAARRNLAATVAELEHSNAQLQQSCTAISASSHVVSERMHEELETLRKENENLAGQLQTANARLKQLLAESQSIQGKNSQLQQQLKAFEASLVSRLDESSAVLATVEAASQQTSVLQAELAVKVADLRNAERTVDTRCLQIKELEQHRSGLNEQLVSAQGAKETEHNNYLQVVASHRAVNDQLLALQAELDAARAENTHSSNVSAQLQAQLEHVSRERAQVIEQLEAATSLLQSLRHKVVPHGNVLAIDVDRDAQEKFALHISARIAAVEGSYVQKIAGLMSRIEELNSRCSDAEKLVELHRHNTVEEHVFLHEQLVAEAALSHRLITQLENAQATEQAAVRHCAELKKQLNDRKPSNELSDRCASPGARAVSLVSISTQTQELPDGFASSVSESRSELASKCRALQQLVEAQSAQNLGLQNEVLLQGECRREYQSYATALSEKFTSMQIRSEGLQSNADELARQLHAAQDLNSVSTAEVSALRDRVNQLETMLQTSNAAKDILVAEKNALMLDADVAHQEYTRVRSQLECSLEAIQAQVQALQQEVEHVVEPLKRTEEEARQTMHDSAQLSAQLELERSLRQQAQLSLQQNDTILQQTRAELDNVSARYSASLAIEREQTALLSSNTQLIASLERRVANGLEIHAEAKAECRRLHDTLISRETLLAQAQNRLDSEHARHATDQGSVEASMMSMRDSTTHLKQLLQNATQKYMDVEAEYKKLQELNDEASKSALTTSNELSTLRSQLEESVASNAGLIAVTHALQSSQNRAEAEIEALSSQLEAAIYKLSAAERMLEERAMAVQEAASVSMSEHLTSGTTGEPVGRTPGLPCTDPRPRMKHHEDTSHVRVVRSCATQTASDLLLSSSESFYTTPDSSKLHASYDSSSDVTVSSLRRKLTSQSRALVASHKREFERDLQIEHLTRLALRSNLPSQHEHSSVVKGPPQWSGADSRISTSDPSTYRSPANYSDLIASQADVNAKHLQQETHMAGETDKITSKPHESVRLRSASRQLETPASSSYARRLHSLKPVSKELILHDTPGPGQTVKLIARCEFFPSPAADPIMV